MKLDREKLERALWKSEDCNSLSEAARKAGITPQGLFVMFNRGRCSMATVKKLSKALQVPPAEILADE